MATIQSFINLVYKKYKKTRTHFIYTCQDINDFVNTDPDLREFNEKLENGYILNDPGIKINVKRMKNLNRDIHTFLTGLNKIGENLEKYQKKMKYGENRDISVFNNNQKKSSKNREKNREYLRAQKKYKEYIKIQMEKYKIPEKRENRGGVPNLYIDMEKVRKNNIIESTVKFPVESYTSPRRIKTPKSSPLRNEISVKQYLSRSRSKSF
jgi:hypothetical protein